MKKITLVLIGIALISFLIFTVNAKAWRGGAGWRTGGWGCEMGQGIGWSYCIPDRVKARISQPSKGCDPNANVTPKWRKDFRRGKRGCGGHKRGCGPCWW